MGREGKDGRLYYDVAVRIRSFAASNQYGLTQQERPQTLEWDRTQLASFGVENKRLYELRIRRESEIVRAGEREGKDGRLYYDVAVRIRSFAASNQYGLTQQERPQTLEWDRTQLASFGVENKRLYELRIQVP